MCLNIIFKRPSSALRAPSPSDEGEGSIVILSYYQPQNSRYNSLPSCKETTVMCLNIIFKHPHPPFGHHPPQIREMGAFVIVSYNQTWNKGEELYYLANK